MRDHHPGSERAQVQRERKERERERERERETDKRRLWAGNKKAYRLTAGISWHDMPAF